MRFKDRNSARVLLVILLSMPCLAIGLHKEKPAPAMPPPDILMDGGRKLSFEFSFNSEKAVLGKPGFWAKVVNIIAGEPDYHRLLRPYSIAVDSRGRLIITDPGSGGVHIFDFARRKYKFLYRPDSDKNPMLSPQCVALDSDDNIYVTDSKVGKVFVFDPNGKLRRVLGSLRGGEGYFKRPTGIAVDSSAHRIYITDTLRDSIFVLDSNGNVLDHFGGRGADDTHFNFPTEVLLRDHTLFIVDAMNFRVQLYENNMFRSSIGTPGEAIGEFFRPKGIAMDSEGHLYVVDAAQSVVQVFDRQGDLLFYFGGTGAELGNFRLPSGIFVDFQDRVYVVDSYNHRVQVFRYTAQPHSKSGDVR